MVTILSFYGHWMARYSTNCDFIDVRPFRTAYFRSVLVFPKDRPTKTV